MKTILRLSALYGMGFLLLASCGKSGHDQHDHGKAEGDNPNQVLYNQVMDIHDEVMPKMEDLYKLKKKMEDEIAQAPNLAEDRKKELSDLIARLDSANLLMMDWMHEFNPLPDSANQEDAREYLENEMERVKKVREKMLEAIKEAEQKVKPE